METESDPLAELIVSKDNALNKSSLRDLLKPFVAIVDDGEILPTEKFSKLADGDKICIYLLARKVMVLKNLLDTEGAKPTEISKKTGIGLSSAKKVTYIKYARKDESGNYYIPNYFIEELNTSFKAKVSQ